MKPIEKEIEEGFELYPDATHCCVNPNNRDDWDFFNENENPGLAQEYSNTKPYIVIARNKIKKNEQKRNIGRNR